MVKVQLLRPNGNGQVTLPQLLEVYGPYWPEDEPPPDDETVLTQLDRFGEAVHHSRELVYKRTPQERGLEAAGGHPRFDRDAGPISRLP